MTRSTERARIELLRAIFGEARDGITLGIGDDAAVLGAVSEPLVWTIDASFEGVHFRREWLSLGDVGYRATMAAASDLAAMGAKPIALLAALGLPESFSDDELRALAAGQREAADEIGACIAGGNLARASELSITTTAIGSTSAPLRRDGAQAGDAIGLAGSVGLAALGLQALARGERNRPELEAAVRAWARPRALIAEGKRAGGRAHAAVDVSDGLSRDLRHLVLASGVTAIVDIDALLTPELVVAATALGVDPVAIALSGGEDYALVVAIPPGETIEGFRVVGNFVPASAEPEVLQRASDGTTTLAADSGFDHFRG